jgi:hypothetical protein
MKLSLRRTDPRCETGRWDRVGGFESVEARRRREGDFGAVTSSWHRAARVESRTGLEPTVVRHVSFRVLDATFFPVIDRGLNTVCLGSFQEFFEYFRNL